MERFSSLFLCLCLVVALAGGCDLMRSYAGLPTAEEVKEMALAIEKQEAEAADSVQKLTEPVADVPMVESLDSMGYEVVAYSSRARQFVDTPEDGYYLIIGYFNSEENVRNLVSKAKADGYDALVLSNRNGGSSVALAHTSTSSNMARLLKNASTLPYVPENAWILECK